MKNSIKKHLTLFFVFFFPSFLTYGLTDADLKELVDERILDGTNMSFKDIPCSNYFIDKFSLNEKEMEMIGIWGFDGIVCKMPYGQKYGPGISIVLYPNRFFCIKKENDENMSIKSIIGKWRVHENILGRFFALLSGIFGGNKKGKNTDYRGAVGTVFEGMQFIYDGKNLVTDSTNMGTFDTISPLSNLIGHFFEDIVPWIFWGNGNAQNQSDVAMSHELEEQINSIYTDYKNEIITRNTAREQIEALMPKKPEEEK